MEELRGQGCCGGPSQDQGDAPRFDDDPLAAVCKALGHPARLAIVRHLRAVDGCVCGRIVEVLPLAQSTVSQHLKVLKDCGLVRGRIDGPSTCYCLDLEVLQRFKDQLAGL